MEIYLVRHGEKIPTAGNPGLTLKGKKQAIKLANYFKDRDIDKIVSSPLKRARDTSDILASILNVEVLIDERLRERLNFGDIKKQTYRQFIEEIRKSSLDRNYILPNGVSSKRNGLGIVKTIRKYAKNKKNLIFLTHGGSISDALRTLFGDKFLKLRYSEFFSRLEVESGSITHIKLLGKKFKLLEIGKIL